MPIPKMKEHKARLCMALKPVSTRDCGKGLEIMDEATSSIDTRTEALVQSGMDELMKGRTVFVIAHRLSTIRNSDAIMVLDHGNIVERGDHASLIREKGIYYQLYTGGLELD